MFEVLRNSRYNDPICQVIMECMCLINNNTRLPRSPEELHMEKYRYRESWAFPTTGCSLSLDLGFGSTQEVVIGSATMAPSGFPPPSLSGPHQSRVCWQKRNDVTQQGLHSLFSITPTSSPLNSGLALVLN